MCPLWLVTSLEVSSTCDTPIIVPTVDCVSGAGWGGGDVYKCFRVSIEVELLPAEVKISNNTQRLFTFFYHEGIIIVIYMTSYFYLSTAWHEAGLVNILV